MKKNTRTYVLLATVLLIWGTIAYRIFGSFGAGPMEAEVGPPKEFVPQPMGTKDTFGIYADYRDPFLGTVKTKKKEKSAPAPVKKEIPPQLDIRYTGSIAGVDAGQRIFFVAISGQQHLMSLKDKVGEVTLLKGNAGEITVQIGKTARAIPLQE
jgi:hypothetical protein